MEEIKEIDTKVLLKDILKRAWIIVLCTVVFAAGALIYTKNFVAPTYKASITMYVVNNLAGEGGMASSDLAVALQMTKSYIRLIESERVLDKVVEEAELTSISASDIRKMMKVEVLDETEVFTVSIISPNPKMSADIANAIASYAPAEIYNITKGSRVEVVDLAKVPESRYGPNYTTNTLLGGIIGAVLSTATIAFLLLSDNRVKNKEDLIRICQVPVLGAIPDFAEAAKHVNNNGVRKEQRRK